MKKFLIVALAVIHSLATFSQKNITFKQVRVKWEYPPLEPLPAEKNFSVSLPNGLSFLENKAELAPYWSPFGLILVNKWDGSNNEYVFKLDIRGIQLTSIDAKEEESNVNPSGAEYFRDYTFNCPAKLLVVNKSTGETIRTITLVYDNEEFVRRYHRNFFISSIVDPNYKKEVGFGTLKEINLKADKDVELCKHLEGVFMSDVVFERMKESLVRLYGKPLVRAEFYVMLLKEKDRKYDYADFDKVSQQLIKVLELLKENRTDQASTPLLNEVEQFYLKAEQDKGERFVENIPALVYWNLATIKLLKNDVPAADVYYEKVVNSSKPGFFKSMTQPAFEEFRTFIDRGNTLVEMNAHHRPTISAPAKTSPVQQSDLTPATAGIVVTLKNDTLRGSFSDFDKTSIKTHSVVFLSTEGKQRIFEKDSIKAVSTNGVVYESIPYNFNGIFSGDQAVPGKKVMVLIYESANIKLYFYRQAKEFIYYFPKSDIYKRYQPFTRDDAASFVTNFNKKLGDVFAGCSIVLEKINKGEYKLKEENSEGPVRALADYETSCGSKEFEANVDRLKAENVKKLYQKRNS